MNLQLVTQTIRPDGAFSEIFRGLSSDFQYHFSYALERVYPTGDPDSPWAPKLPRGQTFTCERGTHELHSGLVIVTFEIKGVEGHTGMLFHVANVETELEGCVGLGEDIVSGPDVWMLTASGDAFKSFMLMQAGVEEFLLEVC